MRSSTRWALALAMAAGGAAALAPRVLVANGTIDTSGATIGVGSAPVPGSVTTDEAAHLGILPRLEPPPQAWSFGFRTDGEEAIHDGTFGHYGLGGTDLRAQVDLTYPGGTYDYGSFRVDRGVTVRFTGPVTLRATNEIRIDGRIEMDGGGVLKLDCSGDVTIVGHDDPVATGLFAEDADAQIRLHVGGVFDVSADAGARAHFRADQGRGGVLIYCDRPDPTATTSIADAVFDAAAAGSIYVRAEYGFLTLTNCTTSGPVANVYARGQDNVFPYADAYVVDEATATFRDVLTISGGTYAGAFLRAHYGLRVTGGATITGGRSTAIWSFQGAVGIDGASSITSDETVQVWGSAVTIGDGCEVRTTATTPTDYPRGIVISAVGGLAGISIGEGAVIEDVAGPALVLRSSMGIDVGGTVRGHGASADLFSVAGDVLLHDGADVDAPNGALRLWAGGAVVAEGGAATLSAKEYDVRCVTGDLDLDVATMEATAGRIVAMSNGPVRLRGAYRASGDVQVISLADAIDVHGATLETADATSAPSGFVRMATYAATSIDAGAATLSTGASDAQSGDVLIQVQEAGSLVSQGVMKVGRVAARRVPDGVVTQVTGTIVAPKLREIELTGSARLTAGELTRRLVLQGVTGHVKGTDQHVTVRLARTGRNKARFVLEIRESGATSGTQAAVRFSRAGLHAAGTFRRPKAK